jgi:tight adherence protein B
MAEPADSRLIQELATLIDAGLHPRQAREMLDEPLSRLAEPAKKQLQLNWQLAHDLGAPIVDTLQQLALNLDRLLGLSRAQQLAYSTPKLTAQLIYWLPLASLVLAQLLGLNPIGAIVSNFVALVSVLLGLGLLALAYFWTQKLIAAAKPASNDPGLFVDAVAVAMLAGLPISSALAEARHRYINVFSEEPPSQVVDQLHLTADFVSRTGAAAVKILRALASDLRNEQQQQSAEKIDRLGIRLLLPIGLAVLPAFGLLTVVPISFGFLSNSN